MAARDDAVVWLRECHDKDVHKSCSSSYLHVIYVLRLQVTLSVKTTLVILVYQLD